MTSLKLRSYQSEARDAALGALRDQQRAMVVMATGLGKTPVLAQVAKDYSGQGRVLLLAHREELIFQMAATIERVTGSHCDIEMGAIKSSTDMFRRSRYVASTVQTQLHRKGKFDPKNFSLIVVDEAHRTTSSYKTVIDYYLDANPEIHILGVTATPNRTDKQELKSYYKSICYRYGIREGIDDGWLCPLKCTAVEVESLDYSDVRVAGGDLSGPDLARVMEEEKNLHAIALATLKNLNGRSALVFTVTVAQAERLTLIFNRYKPAFAEFVCGTTPKNERRAIVERFRNGSTKILCNVGVFTEGFDAPEASVAVIARPTKSTNLYSQMVGRILRPNVDNAALPDDSVCGRKDSILSSRKPFAEVLDFVDVSRRHRLATAVDLLSGSSIEALKKKEQEEILDRARRIIQEAEGPVDPDEALEQAMKLRQAEIQRQKEIEESKRAKLKAAVKFKKKTVDPFATGLCAPRPAMHMNDVHDPPSEKQLHFLWNQGVATDNMSKQDATRAIGTILSRRDKGLCSMKQVALLRKYNIDGMAMTTTDASKHITAIKRNGWRRPVGV